MFQRGLRPQLRYNTAPQFAAVFKGLRPGEDGARLPDRISMPFPQSVLASRGITMDMPEFPQILESFGEYMVATDSTLLHTGSFSHTLGDLAISAATTYDPLNPAATKAIVAGGGRWELIQIGLPTDTTQYTVVQNEKNLVFSHGLIGGNKLLVFTNADGKVPRTITYHKGRFIRGGWNAPYGSGATFPAGWNTIFETWLDETRANWGWSTDSGDHTQVPQPNWIFYSTPGEDDYIYHLMPDVMKNALDSNIDLSSGDTVYGLNLFVDPSFKQDPINGSVALIDSPVTDPWKWFQGFSQTFVDAASPLDDPLTYPSGPSIELAVIDPDTFVTSPDYIEVDPSKMLTPFVVGNTYHIEFTYSFNAGTGTRWGAKLGGTFFFDRVVALEESGTRVDAQVASGVVVCGAVTSSRLGVVTLEIGLRTGNISRPPEMFRIHSIKIREALNTPHNMVREEPENDYFILEQIRRNQAGFLIMPFGGEVLKVKNLIEHVMVYGEDGVAALRHREDRGLALSYMGLEEPVWSSGCAAREAIAGDEREHFWIDAVGNLWRIDAELGASLLGYKEYLRELLPAITGTSTTQPIMSFDEFERQVYISGIEVDGTHRTYVYDSVQKSFYEINQKVSSLHNANNNLVGIVEDQSDFEAISVTSNTLDLGYRGLKEIFPTEIASELIRNGALDISYNTDTETRFLAGAISDGGMGTFHNRAAGREFQFLYTGDGYQDVLADGSFGDAADWTANGNWTVAAGKASHTGADAGDLVSVSGNIANPLIAGEVYLVEYDIDLTSTNGVNIIVGGTSGIKYLEIGRNQELIVAGSGADIAFHVTTSLLGSLDNVRVMLTGARLNHMRLHYDIVDRRFTMSPIDKRLVG